MGLGYRRQLSIQLVRFFKKHCNVKLSKFVQNSIYFGVHTNMAGYSQLFAPFAEDR